MSEKRKQIEGRIVTFVKGKGEASAEEVAATVGVSPSTARKYLAGLAGQGELTRTEGGRERARKRPDRFSVAVATKKDRLRPGGLDDHVLGYMREHRDAAPHTASRIGKGIAHSSGAIANCLKRLGEAKRVRLAQEKPRAYDLPEGE
ncbi:MAG: DeoR family transcriptional regulator [Solirubrobacterales bacterium]